MIYFITGGARSGKSSYAMKLAKSKSPNPVYIATARVWDDDFKARIDRHREERDETWQTIEEEKHPGKLDLEGRVAVIDCVTLWMVNLYSDFDNNIENCLKVFKNEIDTLKNKDATIIIISNELGMGLHAENETGRKFTDMQGWANQYVAQNADVAIFMVSGLPVVLKDPDGKLQCTHFI